MQPTLHFAGYRLIERVRQRQAFVSSPRAPFRFSILSPCGRVCRILSHATAGPEAMPAPYSDNLYSGDDNPWDGEQNDALSPTDGYFHASSGLEEAATSSPSPPVRQQRQSASVPFVPNVMVEDPTLQEDRAAAKAREAAEERLINSASAGRSSPLGDSQPHHQTIPFAQGQASFYPSHPSHPSPPPRSQVATHPQLQAHHHSASASASSSSASSGHYHRRSIDEEISPFQPSSAAGQAPNQYTVQRPADAPPAYSPSASSPPLSSGYQTFAPPQAGTHPETMGLPEENQTLLPRQPESMGGAVNGSREPLWQRIKGSITRKKIRTVLGVLVIISIILALFGGSIGIHDRRVSKALLSSFPKGFHESMKGAAKQVLRLPNNII